MTTKRPWNPPEIVERGMNKYYWIVFHKENLTIGKYTDIGAFTLLDASCGIEIQEGAMIGSHCSLYSRTAIDNKQGKIIMKKNSAVSSHCVVMPGVIIGENAIVGAQSFVNKDIPDDEIWAGSPARFIRKRTEDDYREVNQKNRNQ